MGNDEATEYGSLRLLRCIDSGLRMAFCAGGTDRGYHADLRGISHTFAHGWKKRHFGLRCLSAVGRCGTSGVFRLSGRSGCAAWSNRRLPAGVLAVGFMLLAAAKKAGAAACSFVGTVAVLRLRNCVVLLDVWRQPLGGADELRHPLPDPGWHQAAFGPHRQKAVAVMNVPSDAYSASEGTFFLEAMGCENGIC